MNADFTYLKEKFTQLWEKRNAWLRERNRPQRLDDLFRKIHTVRKVSLPLLNLFADHQIKEYFGGDYDKIDLNDPRHVAAVVFFLRNQESVKIVHLTAQEREDRINEVMAEIPKHELADYQSCIYEIFFALEKKMIGEKKKMLEGLLHQLEIGTTL